MLTIYTCILYLAFPFLLLRLLWRGRKNPAYRTRWRERFACYRAEQRRNPLPQSVWVHAVSLGEAVAATPLVKALQQKYPQLPIVFTTMTPTGAAHIVKTFGEQKQVISLYVPYDYPGAVRRFLDYANPKFLLIMETELWPNILHSCAKRHIPIFLANARLTDRSLRGYNKVRHFTQSMLANINLICAQSQKDADYFLQLGAIPSRVTVMGNIKFDIALPEGVVARGEELRHSWSSEKNPNGTIATRPAWIAASTHPGEEEIVLAAHIKVLQHIPNAILILVPRHVERAGEIAQLCTKNGMKTVRYGDNEIAEDAKISSGLTEVNVILVTVMGQLLPLYAAADIAFVGGSLVPIGGHNVLEPAALAKPIIVGPHTKSLADVRTLLEKASGLIGVQNSNELAGQVVRLLQDTDLRQCYGAAAQKVVAQNHGIVGKILGMICCQQTADYNNTMPPFENKNEKTTY